MNSSSQATGPEAHSEQRAPIAPPAACRWKVRLKIPSWSPCVNNPSSTCCFLPQALCLFSACCSAHPPDFLFPGGLSNHSEAGKSRALHVSLKGLPLGSTAADKLQAEAGLRSEAPVGIKQKVQVQHR